MGARAIALPFECAVVLRGRLTSCVVIMADGRKAGDIANLATASAMLRVAKRRQRRTRY